MLNIKQENFLMHNWWCDNLF